VYEVPGDHQATRRADGRGVDDVLTAAVGGGQGLPRQGAGRLERANAQVRADEPVAVHALAPGATDHDHVPRAVRCDTTDGVAARRPRRREEVAERVAVDRAGAM